MSEPRTEPCDFRELAIIRGLCLNPDACAWFVGMGIGWEIFQHKPCQAIAAWALGGCVGVPPKIQGAFATCKDGSWSLAGWLAPEVADFKPEWGMRDVKKYSRELAQRWLPMYLRDQAEYVERSERVNGSLVDMASHHRKVLNFIAGEDV